MLKLVSEYLTEVGEAEDKIEKMKEVIRKNPAVFDVLRVAFDPEWEFALGEGYPNDYTPNLAVPRGMSETELVRDRRKLQIFCKRGPYAALDPERREYLFMNFLDSLHSEEAEVLVWAKDGVLDELYPWLTVEFFNQLTGANFVGRGKKSEEPDTKSQEPQVEEKKSEPPIEDKTEEVVQKPVTEETKPEEPKKRRGRPPKAKPAE